MPDTQKKRDAAKSIVRTLTKAGHDAVFAGGCVRDALLGQEPSDFDLATSASPDEVVALFPKTVEVGRQFGVVMVVVDGLPFEVATYRSDGPYSDGRHPDTVNFPVAREEDVKRRDFTVNGLMQDPFTRDIFDYVGGVRDILARTIRAIGDPRRRFEEDRLRILRAVRFAARLGFAIDPDTWQAMTAMAPRISKVAFERVRDELEKLLTGPRPAYGLGLLEQSGLLARILPEVARLRTVEQSPDYHPEGDVLSHTMLVLSYLPASPSPALAWAALLHDIGKAATAKKRDGRWIFHYHETVGAEMAESVATRLRFSRELRERVVMLVKSHMRLVHVSQMRDSTFKRLAREPWFEELLWLTRADCLGSHGDLLVYHEALRRYEAVRNEPLRPPRLITGNDLKSMGIPPGPVYKKILGKVEDAQLEGMVTTRDEALEYAARLWQDS